MYFKLETTLDFFIFFIIIIKIIFVISAISHAVLSRMTSSNAKQFDNKIVYWKERTEFIFTICMAILLIYHFKPGKNKPINEETTILFYLFGWILIFTANWNLFYTEAPWYKKITSLWK